MTVFKSKGITETSVYKRLGRFINTAGVCLNIAIPLTLAQDVSAHDGVHLTKNSGNPRGVEVLDFEATHIERVVSAGYPVSFGVYAFSRRKQTETLTLINNDKKPKNCVKANFLAFDIDDDYAFDINENVSVEFLIDRAQTQSLVYGFDQHGSEKANGLIDLTDSTLATDKRGLKQVSEVSSENNEAVNLVWVKAVFNKARFANRGISNTDFVLTTNETMLYEKSLAENVQTTFVLCDVVITRNTASSHNENKVNVSDKSTKVSFNFVDENGDTPVRLGLYDNKGSAVLLDNPGVILPFYEDTSQQHSLPAFYPPYQFWPHKNRYYYYVDSQFSQALAPGSYTLIATKGPEYKISKQHFTVTANNQPLNLTVGMERWLDLPRLGWYSGDVHIHIERAEKDNKNLAKVFAAEDLHFSNLLEMSTNETDHFKQYSFGEKGMFSQDDYNLVSGIEGPRTAHRGHSIALNVKEAFKVPNSFFLYHKYFDFYKKQEAVIGYAHVGSKEFNASLGLALDMPFGLIDFVEIMQSQRLRTEFWYEFLNLGFKLAPAAGSDYPYFEQPGAVRSYVKMPSSSLPMASRDNIHTWYQQLKKGNTYVSNMPFIELSANGKGIGARINVQENRSINITAKISINTDYDTIDNLELIHCGKVIKQLKVPNKGSDTLNFSYQMSNDESGWIALRGKGKGYALAHTGAIYLEDELGNSQCKNQAEDIIDTMLARLNKLKSIKLDISKELEFWEAQTLEQSFDQQKNSLEKRIAVAQTIYLKMKADLLKQNH